MFYVITHITTTNINESLFSFKTFLDCPRPGGCTGDNDVYWTGDCDNDGRNDHVCSTTNNNNVWVVLSSTGCGGWKQTNSRTDCSAAFTQGTLLNFNH